MSLSALTVSRVMPRELISLVLQECNYTAGTGIFVEDLNLVAVSCRKSTEGETAKACTDNRYFHFTA